MKQCHTIKKKIVDYLDSICFFKNSSCSDLIIMRKGKRRKQKQKTKTLDLVDNSFLEMFVSKRKCYSRFSHKFCGMKTLPLFQVFMLPLTGLPFHFHRSYQSFCVTAWSVTSLGVLQITFVYFWVLVLCLYTEMAEHEPVSLRANLQNYLCHL